MFMDTNYKLRIYGRFNENHEAKKNLLDIQM